jgi:hypothetical protein
LFGGKHRIASVIDDRGGIHHAPDRSAGVVRFDFPHQAKHILHRASECIVVIQQVVQRIQFDADLRVPLHLRLQFLPHRLEHRVRHALTHTGKIARRYSRGCSCGGSKIFRSAALAEAARSRSRNKFSAPIYIDARVIAAVVYLLFAIGGRIFVLIQLRV